MMPEDQLEYWLRVIRKLREEREAIRRVGDPARLYEHDSKIQRLFSWIEQQADPEQLHKKVYEIG